MAIMPSKEEAERQREARERRHAEELKKRPYMDHGLGDLIHEMRSYADGTPEYNMIKEELNERGRIYAHREIPESEKVY